MNFFAAQDHARRLTRWLVLVYVAATALIVAGVTLVVAVGVQGLGVDAGPANPKLLLGVAICTVLVIVGASLFRTARLSSGGSKVAEELGGSVVGDSESDPLKRRLRNVVEEMAIASGVPVPAIYVLERETGINAFAAGFTPDDAAVAVTRGALEVLDREELQGVVAHEFSHILNGDMRLNIRLIGVLFGIMVIGLIGRTLLRGSYHSGGSVRASGRNRNTGGIALIGVGLTVLGGIGVFFARLIKAAVSRQREYLADASAVQFTRQSDGIANALKKIGGYSDQSFIRATDPEEVSHMLFALGAKFSSMFATHPPLGDRIRALDPSFSSDDFPVVQRRAARQAPTHSHEEPRTAGFAAGRTADIQVEAADVYATVGNPQPAHVAYASALHDALPDDLVEAAHGGHTAWLLVLAVFLPRDAESAHAHIDFLAQRIGQTAADRIRGFVTELAGLDTRLDYALLELAFPALRRAGTERMEFLADTARELIEYDGEIDLREYCLFEVLSASLRQAAQPSRQKRGSRPNKRQIRQAAIDLVQVLATQAGKDGTSRERAFQAGIAEFGRWGSGAELTAASHDDVAKLGRALTVLRELGPKASGTLVKAALATVLADGHIASGEAEIVRAVCASLRCPLPPIIASVRAAD